MPHEEQKKRNIQNVLEQALELFVKFGPDETSIQTIGKAAHVTGRSVHNYFESKNDLMKAVMRYALDAAYQKFDEYVSTPEYAAKNGLEQCLGIMNYLLQAGRIQYRVVNCITEIELRLSRENCYDAGHYVSRAESGVAARFAQAIRRGTADGTIRPELRYDMGMANALTYISRGIYRQIAFVMRTASMKVAYNPDSLIDRQLELTRRVLAVFPENKAD